MLHHIRTLTDFQLILKETSAIGKTVIFIYNEGSPSFHELKHVYELISRECPTSKFHTMNMEVLESSTSDPHELDFIQHLNIMSLPIFLVKTSERMQQFETSTTIGLVKVMKRCGVLDEHVNIISS